VDASEFALHCTPAINLFPKRADRIHVNERETEFHVVPDRTRPMDFEVFGVTGVTGFGAGFEQSFRPLYSSDDFTHTTEGQAYYAIQRLPRVLSAKQRQVGPRSTYIGSELYLSLVDANEAPYRSDLRQLGIDTVCTNRDLPLFMPVGAGGSDFNLESGAPVESVRGTGLSLPRAGWSSMPAATARSGRMTRTPVRCCGPARSGAAPAAYR
jgi:type VI secretion system protein ImpG